MYLDVKRINSFNHSPKRVNKRNIPFAMSDLFIHTYVYNYFIQWKLYIPILTLSEMISASEVSAILLLFITMSRINFVNSNIGNWEACSGRLERALDAIHRDSSKKSRSDDEETSMFYQQELRSAPLEMSVSRLTVKLPKAVRDTGNPWARVEKCIYEPNNNSLQTRVMLNDLSVSGMISLMPRDHQPPIPAESCRMTLRLRRAGVDFLTSPIARGRGQMRIRTESSFLEPRFASIYAYGCHPTRLDKQIKRQDKWPPFYPPRDEYVTLSPTQSDEYEAAEPRQLVGVSKEVDVVIPNETRQPRFLGSPISKLGIWRKNVWLTKSLRRDRRDLAESSSVEGSTIVHLYPGSFESSRENSERPIRITRSTETITPEDFASALSSKGLTANGSDNCTQQSAKNTLYNTTNVLFKRLNGSVLKANFKRENSYQVTSDSPSKESRHLYIDETLDSIFPIDLENDSRNWQSKEYIAREMEDVFLRGASQALTRYIERQLHPAIKETLMVSMGYTISYG